MSTFSEYKEAKVGQTYSTFYVPGSRPALTLAQKERAKENAKLRRIAYKDPVAKEAWINATSAQRSAAAKARGRPPGSDLATTKGYFLHHAASKGIMNVSNEAIKAVNKLLAEERRNMIHKAVAHAKAMGSIAVLGSHVAAAIAPPPGMRSATRIPPPLRVKKARAPRFSQLPLE